MKIDDALRIRLADVVGQNGGVKKFAACSGVDAANISRYLRGISRSIKDENWEKLLPFLDNGSAKISAGDGAGFIASSGELAAFISGRMKLARIADVEKLCQRMNFNSYETLRRHINGNLNWPVATLSRVFEVLSVTPEEAPLTEAELQLFRTVADHTGSAEASHSLPVLCGMENGSLAMDGSIAVSGNTQRELRAFRISGDEMMPLLLPGDVVIAEEVGSFDDIPDNALVLVRLNGQETVPESMLCRRFRRISGCPAVLSSDAPAGEWFPVSAEAIQWCGVVRRRISEFF